MTSLKKTAHLAGVLYLIVVITGIFGLKYVPGKLMIKEDPAATVSNILSHEWLFKINILDGLFAFTFFLLTVFVLYYLFKEVNKQLAFLMLVLVIVQVPGNFQEAANQMTALQLLHGENFMSGMDQPQRERLAMMLVDLNGTGYLPYSLFWGLWLFPLGILVFRSGFIPKFIGVWLLINGVAYVIISITGILSRENLAMVNKIAMPALFGEMAFMLWLLIAGARHRPYRSPKTSD